MSFFKHLKINGLSEISTTQILYEPLLQYQHEYALPANTKDLRIRNFIETAAGFLFAGSQDGITGANDDRVILLITGKTGDLLSRKLLTNEYYYTYVSAIQKIDENTFIITGGAQLDYVNSWDTNSYFPFLIAVDSTGNEKWRWQLPPNDNEVSFGGICRRPDGGWVYGSARKVVTGTGPSEYGYQSRIVSRNAAMQLEWSQNLGDKQFSRMGSIQATPDGNYLAYGSDLFVDYDLFQGGLMGTIRKFTPDGDSVWQRTDTIGSYSQGTGFRSYEGHYGGLGFLSSGSIVACGYNRVEHGTSNRQLAWLVKISPDGCIDTLNCVPGVVGIKEPPALGSGEASVYPNPASDHFQVLYDLKSPGGAFLLFDAMGRLVRSRVLEDGSGSLSVEVSGLPAGVYAWALRAVGGGVLSGRVLLGMER